ncbi:hypothetical protein HY227_02115 [Candidatus Wolfebacteria bacterium]|nr:hypothetical protein [Candidatus Wolfebacteria bacterium]
MMKISIIALVLGMLGILVYGLFFIMPKGDFIGGSFLASGTEIFKNEFGGFAAEKNKKEGILNTINKDGGVEKSIVHFDKKINISDIKVSSRSPKLIFAGSNFGLFASRDYGKNWYNFSDIEKNIDSDAQIYKILTNPAGYSFISVFKNKKGIVYKTGDDFMSVDKILELDSEAVYDFDLNGDNLYMALSDGWVLKFSTKENKIENLKKFTSPVTNLKVENEGKIVYTTLKSGGFFASVNGGKDFERKYFLADYGGAEKIKMFLANNFSVYAATDYGLIKSENSGNTWKSYESLPGKNEKVSVLAINPELKEIVAASRDKIYESSDFGLSWLVLDPQISGGRKISTIADYGDKIIVGTEE